MRRHTGEAHSYAQSTVHSDRVQRDLLHASVHSDRVQRDLLHA
jgi:hypothetical protein